MPLDHSSQESKDVEKGETEDGNVKVRNTGSYWVQIFVSHLYRM